MRKKLFIYILCLAMSASACAQKKTENNKINIKKDTVMSEEIKKTEEEWKKELTPEQYYVCREKGTERAFTGKFYATKDKGMYKCSACGNPLFSSDTKFDSGTGWPSFYMPVDSANVKIKSDFSHGMIRTEVMCAKCGSHLGHVFDDGPKPTGQRYCINSVSLDLDKTK